MTTASIVIERLGADDVERARNVFAMMDRVFEADSDELTDSYLADLLGRRSFWALAAFDGDEAVGGITAHDIPMTRHERSELFIYDLAVRDDRQREGIGRRLLAELLADARTCGIDVVFVPADNDDLHALDFYEALGGRSAPVTMFDFGAE